MMGHFTEDVAQVLRMYLFAPDCNCKRDFPQDMPRDCGFYAATLVLWRGN